MCDGFLFSRAQRAADLSKAAAEYILQRRHRKRSSSGFHPLCCQQQSQIPSVTEGESHVKCTDTLSNLWNIIWTEAFCAATQPVLSETRRQRRAGLLNFAKLLSLWLQPEPRKHSSMKISGIKLAVQITRLPSPALHCAPLLQSCLRGSIIYL